MGPVAIVVNCPDLDVTKTADAASVSAGDPIGYTVTITNAGPGTATGVSLADSLPGGNAGAFVHWDIDPATGDPASFGIAGADGAQVLSLVGQPISLPPGASLSVHVTAATSGSSCASYDNTASLTSTNDGSPTAGPVTITVNCGDLAITKTADAPSVSAGTPIGYVITVTNNGAGTVFGLQVSDTLPTNGGLAWTIDAPGSDPGWTIAGGVLSFGPAPLAPGASVAVHITSPTTAATCGTVDNSAAASSLNDGSPTVGPVAIVVNCHLDVTKPPTPASARATRSATRSRSPTPAPAPRPASASPTSLPGGNAGAVRPLGHRPRHRRPRELRHRRRRRRPGR